MQASELRLGNLLKHTDSGKMLPVVHLDIEREMFGVEAIPLTEEWLLRFGFTYRNEHRDDGFIMDYTTGDWKTSKSIGRSKGRWIMLVSYNSPCEYVHQLQNLYFALTGEELKLKTDDSK